MAILMKLARVKAARKPTKQIMAICAIDPLAQRENDKTIVLIVEGTAIFSGVSCSASDARSRGCYPSLLGKASGDMADRKPQVT